MARLAGLHHQAATPRPRPHEAGGPHEERHRLLSGTHPRRQQLLVDVEEHHLRRPIHPVEHRFGSHQDVGGSNLGGRGLGIDLANRTGCQCLQFLTDTGHSCTQVAEPQSTAGVAHHRATHAVHRTVERSLLGLHQRHPVLLTTGQLPAPVAGQQPGTATTVEHADHWAADARTDRSQHRNQPLAQQAA